MGQCKKILDSGERCSNQAVPGTQFCQSHGKIVFRPVKEQEQSEHDDSEPFEPSLETVSKGKGSRAAAGLPVAQKPEFPGLRRDERNILVASEGVIFLKSGEKTEPDSLFNRLVRVMSFVSQTMVLTDQVRIMRSNDSGDILVFLTPKKSKDDALSRTYDAVSAAAQLAEGRLYIGGENNFVLYRDNRAPRGYDVPDFKAGTRKNTLTLLSLHGAYSVALNEFKEIPLNDFCLQIAPVLDRTVCQPEQIYALAPQPFYPILCRYFRKHNLSFSLSQIKGFGDDLILFHISPRPDMPTDRSVPCFTLNYLASMPRVVLLTSEHEPGKAQILVQWKHRYPLQISSISEAFNHDDMILLISEHYSNLHISPCPQFFDGNQLIHVHAPQMASNKLHPEPVDDSTKLKVPLRLRPDNGPVPPIAGLILTNQELLWIKTLIYRIPPDIFRAYSLCQGQEVSVLIGNNVPIEAIPFGVPLRRVFERELFIPLRSRIVPELPWKILKQAMNIDENMYTFLTDEYRIDIPVSEFTPLTRSLIADPNRQPLTFTISLTEKQPELKWTPLPVVKEEKGFSSKLGNWFSKKEQPKEEKTSSQPPHISDKNEHIDTPLKRQAKTYEESNDFLAAALCYSILKDSANSARCYRKAVDFSALEQILPPIEGKK